MAERTTITQTVQIGVEAVPGTPVAANKKLNSLMIDISPNIETKQYRAAGNKYKSLSVPTKEWTRGKLSGAATYTELIYALASVLAYAAPVQQAATPAYLWTFASATSAPDTVKTFTVEQGSSVRAHRAANCLVTALELAFSRDGIDVSGELIAKAIEDGVVMTAAPAELALIPVLPTQVDVYLADAQADLDAAIPLTRALSATWGVADRFGGVFPLATQFGTGFATTIEIEPAGTAKLLLEADAAGMALLSTMRAGDTKFMRIEAVGENIDVGQDYRLTIDTALKVESVDEFSDADGIYAIGWNFSWVHDPVWGKSHQVEIVNELTAL